MLGLLAEQKPRTGCMQYVLRVVQLLHACSFSHTAGGYLV